MFIANPPRLGKTARTELRKLGIARAFGFRALRALGRSDNKIREQLVPLDAEHAALNRTHEEIVFDKRGPWEDRAREVMAKIKDNRARYSDLEAALEENRRQHAAIKLWHPSVSGLLDAILKHFHVSSVESLVPGFDDGDTSGEDFRAGQEDLASSFARDFGGMSVGEYRG